MTGGANCCVNFVADGDAESCRLLTHSEPPSGSLVTGSIGRDLRRRGRPPQSARKPEPSRSIDDGSGAVTLPGTNFTSVGRSVKLSVKNVNDDGRPATLLNVKAAELPLSTSVAK